MEHLLLVLSYILLFLLKPNRRSLRCPTPLKLIITQLFGVGLLSLGIKGARLIVGLHDWVLSHACGAHDGVGVDVGGIGWDTVVFR